MSQPIMLNLDSWTQTFAEKMAVETLRIFTAQGTKYGADVTKELTMKFVSEVTKALLLTILKGDGSEIGPVYKAEAIIADFKSTRRAMASKIGDAFSSAMTEFSGHHVDYYCEINIVPEPTNKMPC